MSKKTELSREAQHADDLLEVAELANGVTKTALIQAYHEGIAGKLKDPAGAARNAQVVAAVAIDKRLLLQERPTQKIDYSFMRNPNWLEDTKRELLALAQKYGIVVDGTSEDVTHTLAEDPTAHKPELGW